MQPASDGNRRLGKMRVAPQSAKAQPAHPSSSDLIKPASICPGDLLTPIIFLTPVPLRLLSGRALSASSLLSATHNQITALQSTHQGHPHSIFSDVVWGRPTSVCWWQSAQARLHLHNKGKINKFPPNTGSSKCCLDYSRNK